MTVHHRGSVPLHCSGQGHHERHLLSRGRGHTVLWMGERRVTSAEERCHYRCVRAGEWLAGADPGAPGGLPASPGRVRAAREGFRGPLCFHGPQSKALPLSPSLWRLFRCPPVSRPRAELPGTSVGQEGSAHSHAALWGEGAPTLTLEKWPPVLQVGIEGAGSSCGFFFLANAISPLQASVAVWPPCTLHAPGPWPLPAPPLKAQPALSSAATVSGLCGALQDLAQGAHMSQVFASTESAQNGPVI